MPVPDTNNYSLQDIVDEIANNGGPTVDNLVDALAASRAAGFDSVYNNMTGMKRWRKYTHRSEEECVEVQFIAGKTGGSYTYIVCGQDREQSYDLRAGASSAKLCVVLSSIKVTGGVTASIIGPCTAK